MGSVGRVRAAGHALIHSDRPRSAHSVDPLDMFGPARIVVQPIVSVSTGAVLAIEALARFADDVSTEQVFAAAYAAGQGLALEATCLRAALELRSELPPGILLTVNVSPNGLRHIAALDHVWPDDLTGVIVEVTEQDVDRPDDVMRLLAELREHGAAIAIDDVSTGYAGLLRLAQLRPDYVKIDRQVVSGVGDSVAQAAVLEALVTLSQRLGAAVIGEGVEQLADLAVLGELDVDYAQGYAIAAPAPELRPIDPAVVAACRSGRQQLLSGESATGHAARTRDVYAVTAALAHAGRRHDVGAAIRAAATDLGVDVIGVSILASGLNLREIATTESALDPNVYSLKDYPATMSVFNGAGTTEVQFADPDGDPSERRLMEVMGHASLLLVPARDAAGTIGVLEFAQRTPRRWSAQDIAHAQGLAEHLSPVLRRLGVGTPVPAGR